GEPALVTGHGARDAQRVALLAQQRVAAVPGAVAPDLPGLGEMRDVLGVAARLGDVLLARLQWRADRVQRRYELAVRAHLLANRPCYDLHARCDVGAIRDFDAEHRTRDVQRTHAERNDVHGAIAHATAIQVGHDAFHLSRRHPVVRRAGVGFVDRADEGALLDP